MSPLYRLQYQVPLLATYVICMCVCIYLFYYNNLCLHLKAPKPKIHCRAHKYLHYFYALSCCC